jgi:diamine N-acetyltransferase
MEMIRLVDATVADVPTIRNLAMAIWPVTYSPILSVAQIEYMLGSFYHPTTLQQQMENGEQQYLIAYLGEQPVGFAGFGSQEADTYKLHKLYVLPTLHRSGAGSALLAKVLQRSKAAGAQKLILNVHRSNPAKGFYEKLGFRIYEVKDIPFGPGFVLNDYLMEKDL